MEIISARCCGLDVPKREVVAYVVITGSDELPSKTIQAFGTMTPDILALAQFRPRPMIVAPHPDQLSGFPGPAPQMPISTR